MDKNDYVALVLVAGVAAALGYGVARGTLGVGQAAVVMVGLLVVIALGEWMATPPPSALALESEPERPPIGFHPPS